MPITRYAFLISAIEAKLTRSIRRDQFLSMLDKKSIYDALVSISDTDIGEFMRNKISPDITLADAEYLLYDYLRSEIYFIKSNKINEVNRLIDSYILKYDLQNICFITRALFYEKENIELIPIGLLYERSLHEELLHASDFKDIVYTLRKASLYDYARAVSDHIEGLRSKDLSSLRSMEADLYRIYYRTLLRTASSVRGGVELKRAIRKLIDEYNIMVVLRGILSATPKSIIVSSLIEPTMYISLETLIEAAEQNNVSQALQVIARTPYERIISRVNDVIVASGNETLIEVVLLQEFLKEIHSDLMRSLFSPQPVLDYILNKELEVSILRTVLWSLWNNIPRELIEPLLRGSKGES